MPRLPNGAKAPKKKKPAPARKASTKSGLPKSYAAKMKKVATNESNAARNGKKPSSVAKANPKKVSSDKLFQQMKRKEAKAFNAKQKARTVAGLVNDTVASAKSSKSSSDWEKGLDVRNWSRGQKKAKSLWDKITFWD